MKLLKTQNVKIGNEDYPLKMSLRAMIEYESMSGKSVGDIDGLKDITMLFYCTVKAGGSKLSYDEFMDLIDERPESVIEFKNIMLSSDKKKLESR